MKRFCLCLFLAAIPAAAQFSSAIQGTVTDASQAAVPDAVVTVTNAATGGTSCPSPRRWSCSGMSGGPDRVDIAILNFAVR